MERKDENRLNNRKSMVFTTLLVALAVLISGCDLIQVNEEKDRKIVVAKVNGEEILKGSILDQYLLYYGESKKYDEKTMASILDKLIEEELVKQKAAAAGHVVNDDIRAEAKQDYEQAIENLEDNLRKQAEEGADPETDYQQLASDKMKEYLTSIGKTEEEYLEMSAEYVAIQNYIDELTKDLKVEDKEIEEYYDEEMKSQIEYPSMSAYYSVPIVTEPAMRRVKHILIMLPEEDTESIQALRQEDKADEADELREEKLKTIHAKAENILKEAKENEDFESLIDKYGEDPGMQQEENKDGYSMLRDASMYEEFLNASFEMEEGEISGLVATDVGYHIIKVYEASEDVIAPLKNVKEDIEEVLLNQKKSEKTNELISEWKDEADIKKYEKRL